MSQERKRELDEKQAALEIKERNQRISDGQQSNISTNIDPNQWHVLNTILSLSAEEQQQKLKTEEMEKKRRHRELLDKQNADRQQILAQAQQEKSQQKVVIQRYKYIHVNLIKCV